MPKDKPAKLNEAEGVGHVQTYRNNRGGRQGRGKMRITAGGAALQQQMMRGEKVYFSGTVYDEGQEIQHSFPVAVRRFGTDFVEFVAEWDPLAGLTE